jgi:hypothetical protein
VAEIWFPAFNAIGEAMEAFLVALVTPPALSPHFVALDRFDPGFWIIQEYPKSMNFQDAQRLRALVARALGTRVQVVPVQG